MLRDVDVVGSVVTFPGCTEVVATALDRVVGEPTVLIVALDEVDEPARCALRQLARVGSQVLVLVDAPDAAQLSRLASLPSSGFLATRELRTDTLRTALRRLANAEVTVSPDFVRTLLAIASDGAGALVGSQVGIRMTAREQEVLDLLVEGLSNKQIARRLDISEHGAKRHVANILAKLNSPNRTLAVVNALRYGLCGPGDPTAV